MATDQPITVYYDGLCPLCSREVAVYRRLARKSTIDWLDLSLVADLPAHRGFDVDAAYRLLHVRDAADQLHIGFEGHMVMWRQLPGFSLLAWTLRRSRPSRIIAERVYRWLTARRPGLRRRQAASGDVHA